MHFKFESALFKLIRWLITGLAAWWLISMATGEGMTFEGSLFAVALYGQFVFWPVALLWIVPAIFRHRPPRQDKRHDTGFQASITHDNIALDTKQDLLWIRDASGAERYVRPGELLAWKTNSDWNNGHFRQRIELDIRDVQRPRWHVLFQRHSDRWVKSSKINGQERDEWFARLRAWNQQRSPRAASQPETGDGDGELPGLFVAYGKAADEPSRKEWLVAFDICCLNRNLNARDEWERLGGTYPGPSPELLRMQGA